MEVHSCSPCWPVWAWLDCKMQHPCFKSAPLSSLLWKIQRNLLIFPFWSCSLVQWICAPFVNSDCSTCTYSASSVYLKATQVISASLFVDLFPSNKVLGASPIWVSLVYASNVTPYFAVISLPCNQPNTHPQTKCQKGKPFSLYVFLQVLEEDLNRPARKSLQSDGQLRAGGVTGGWGEHMCKAWG